MFKKTLKGLLFLGVLVFAVNNSGVVYAVTGVERPCYFRILQPRQDTLFTTNPTVLIEITAHNGTGGFTTADIDFGDGTSASESGSGVIHKTYTHTYPRPGSYIVSISGAMDNWQDLVCSPSPLERSTVTIVVEEEDGGVNPVCGNGKVEPPEEQCDDGNTRSGDGCSSTCQDEGTPVCGNGKVEPPEEQCDDGNTRSGDGCSSTCDRETSGGKGTVYVNSNLNTSWTIDGSFGGNDYSGSGTNASYPNSNYGQYKIIPASVSGYGSPSVKACTAQNCINGNQRYLNSGQLTFVLTYGDGGGDGGPICGNDEVEPPEECDDGNAQSGDGCSSTCHIEEINRCQQPNTDCSDFRTQNVPTTMCPGTTYPVSVKFKNTGTTSWTREGKYRLGSRNPNNNTTWGINRVLLGEGVTVGPGQAYTFNFDVTAPAITGTYDFAWKMIKDAERRQDRHWFGQKSRKLQISVDPAYCGTPVCGNGAVEPPEQCDDGNTQSGDGCSSTCQDEGGGPQCTLTANPRRLFITPYNPNPSSQLSWQCLNVDEGTSCSISPEVGPIQLPQGTSTVNPTSTTTYVLSCNDGGGEEQDVVTVIVKVFNWFLKEVRP